MSSWETENAFGAFLGRALALLEIERPDAYAALCSIAGRRRVRIAVDGTPVVVSFEVGRAVLGGRPAQIHVDVETNSTSIIAALDGRTTLAQLAVLGKLEIRGAVDDVLAFHDALQMFVHGGVRTQSFASLLRDFRGAHACGSQEKGLLRGDR